MRLAVFIAVSALLAALGVRLLRTAHRTGSRPELWLSLGFLCAGASAWLIPLAAHGLEPAVARSLVFVAQGGMSLSIASPCRFAWIVFRHDSRVARAFAPLLIGANLASLPLLLADGAPTPTGALAFIPLFVLGLRVFGVLEAPTPGEPLPAVWRAVLGALGAGLAVALVACWLAFFPPAAYRRWITAGAAQAA